MLWSFELLAAAAPGSQLARVKIHEDEGFYWSTRKTQKWCPGNSHYIIHHIFLINYPHFPFPQPVNLDFTAWFVKEIGDSNAFSFAKIGQNRSKLWNRVLTPSKQCFLLTLQFRDLGGDNKKLLSCIYPKITRLVGILKRMMQNGMRNNYCLICELCAGCRNYGFWGDFSCVFGAQKWWPYSGMGVHNLLLSQLPSSIGSVAIKQQFADLEMRNQVQYYIQFSSCF